MTRTVTLIEQLLIYDVGMCQLPVNSGSILLFYPRTGDGTGMAFCFGNTYEAICMDKCAMVPQRTTSMAMRIADITWWNTPRQGEAPFTLRGGPWRRGIDVHVGG